MNSTKEDVNPFTFSVNLPFMNPISVCHLGEELFIYLLNAIWETVICIVLAISL